MEYNEDKTAMLVEGDLGIPNGNTYDEPVANVNTNTVGSPEPVMPKVEAQKVSNTYWPEIQKALSNGYTRQEIAEYMSGTQKMTLDEADKQVVESVQDKIRSASQAGYSRDEVKDFLITNRYDQSVVSSALQTMDIEKPWQKYDYNAKQQAEEVKDLTDLYKNIYGKYSTTGKAIKGFVNEQAAIEARQEIDELNKSISLKLNERGINTFINPSDGELYMRTEQGLEVPIDSSMLNDLYNSKVEIGGSITGAVIGAKKGGDIGAAIGGVVGGIAGNVTGVGLALPEEAVTIPAGAGIGRAIGTGLGTIIGGATGASTGKAVDMTINALRLKEQLESDLYFTQMKEAGITDGVMSILGAGALKLGKYGFKGVMKAYDFVLAGNSKGAYRALKEIMHVSDEQAETLVKEWETKGAAPLPGRSFEEKAIAATATTQQGSEALVSYAAATNPKLASSVVSAIDMRAKDVVKAIDEVATEDIGKVVKQGLESYTKDVKNYYGEVKNIATEATQGTDFTFNLSDLAIEPVMDSIEKSISNPVMLERFTMYANRIANASEDRSFSGLLELRQAVNNFKYSSTKLKKPDKDALNVVLNKIDSKIANGAKEYIPNKNWPKLWSTAKTEYAKMKQVESNVLYKAINRPGVTEEGIRKFAAKYIDALDGTFDEVMDKLPAKTRVKAEAAVVKQVTDKYTLGNITDKQAIHFPMLAEALKNTNLQTSEAKQLKQIINSMADTFRNDVNLSKVSGNIAVPKFQSYLTTDPIVRAKFELASGIFGLAKRMIPFSKSSRNLALVNKLDKLLEEPLNAKTVREFVNLVPTESKEEAQTLVKQLQIEMAKNPVQKQDFTRMYKQSNDGTFKVTKGALGKGVYLVDRVNNPTGKVIGKEVNMSRLATLDDISALVGREVSASEIKEIPNLEKELLDRGYNGIRVPNRAMLFTEQSTKKSISK